MKPFNYKKGFYILLIIISVTLTASYTERGTRFAPAKFSYDLGDVVRQLDELTTVMDNIGKELEQIRYKIN